MSITLAKTAGFCFGVDRAVNLLTELIEKGESVATIGPIINNQQFVDEMAGRGVRIVSSPSEVKKGEIAVIRSHGVPKSVYDELNALEVNFIDATCPFVSKIHKIVDKAHSEKKAVIIAGDKLHPEVQGINGHCENSAFVVSTPEEFEELYYKLEENEKNNCILVAQTTYNTMFWNRFHEIAEKLYTNIKIFDTICSATGERQGEAAKIARESDLMVVIGGRHSSNTKKLSDVCSKYTKTLLIETKDELNQINVSQFDKIGITAGASTPAHIIKEVLKTMSEILRNEENEDFASLLEQSLESEKIYNGKRVKGVVTSVNVNEVHVDIGAKQAGIIPADELTDNPNLKVEDIVKKGDELELSVVKVNDQEGIVTLSKKRCDAQVGFENLKKAYEEDAVIDGVITDVVRGGVLVYALGTKLFVPASQASNTRVEDLSTLLKKEVKLKVIEINEQRGRAKGSIRAVLNAERKEQQAKFWDEIELDKKYTGEVKSLTTYGAFVDIGGIDGMVHITELSWGKIKHPSEVVKVGDKIDVYVKEFDKEKKRISLGYKSAEDNPWNKFVSEYKVGDVVNVKIVSFAAYGAFAQIIPNVDGLIHISQIANKRVEKVADILKIGESVDAKIIEINDEKKRVSLSMRALLAEDEQKKEKAADAEEAEAEDAE